MFKVEISRWVDIDSEDAKAFEDYKSVKFIVNKCINLKILKSDKLGKLSTIESDIPIWAKIGKECVGIKCSRLASN
jgi:hypothetical protein